MRRCTKIVATLGPACQDESTIRHLLAAGVNVARLNFSHGSQSDHAEVIRILRKIASHQGRSLCIMQDLQGPKIRTGNLESGTVELKPGQPFSLTTRTVPGDEHAVSVDFTGLPQ